MSANIEDAPKIRKLLKKRKKAIARLRALETSDLGRVSIVVTPKGEKKEGRPAPSSGPPSTRELYYYAVLGRSHRVSGNGDTRVKLPMDDTIKAFFIQYAYDAIAAIDGELFDLGFRFPNADDAMLAARSTEA